MIGKKQLIGNIDNIASYTIPHNSTNILHRGLLSSSFIKRVCLIGEEVKSHACMYLKTMRESINPAFHARVIIECVTVKIAELKGVTL